MGAAAIHIPGATTIKWQGLTDLLAEILRVPAALIMQIDPPEMLVLVANDSERNPFSAGERARLDAGLYCEEVMRTRRPLLVPDALQDEAWKDSPDVEVGLVSYLGFPITWPTGDMFGTICVLDDHANHYSEAYRKLMEQCRDVIEADLGALHVIHARLEEEARAKALLEQQVAARTADLSRANARLREEIADRTRAEGALRESRGLLQAITDSSTAVIYVKDVRGHYLFVNRRFEEVNRTDRRAIVGRTDHDLFPRENADAFRDVDRRVLLAGEPLEAEEVVPHHDGLHTYLSLKFPLRDRAGGVYAVCGISTDITERKKLEERRALLLEQEQQARAAAEAAVRMRDDFLSIASHELYTPIAGLKLAVQGMGRESEALPPRARRLLVLAERQCQRVVKLIGDLLDVTRIQADKLALRLEEVDLRALSWEVVERLEAELHQSGSSVRWRADAPVVGTWDRARMEQVVTNLMLNAIKYGAGRPIDVSLDARGERVRLVVADSGIGIEPSRVPRVFERFERGVSAQHYGGLGLGLYITRQIVAAHGGTIEVESEPGVGTSFTVEVPMHTGGLPPPAGEPAPS